MKANQRENTTTSTSSNEYECDKCRDAEMIIILKDGEPVGVPCECKEQKQLRRLFKTSGLTDQQKKLGFSSYRPGNHTEKAFEECRKYVMKFNQIAETEDINKGILLSGSVGVGKTHLILSIINNLLSKKIPCIFVNTPNLMAELLVEQFSENKSKFESKIQKLGTVKVVAFDDIAKEKCTGWVQTQYYRIINERYERRLPTLFTSNHTMDMLSENLGDATASRIYAMTRDRMFHIIDEDHRLRG